MAKAEISLHFCAVWSVSLFSHSIQHKFASCEFLEYCMAVELFSCSTGLNTVFILLIDVKMLTIVDFFNICEQNEFQY